MSNYLKPIITAILAFPFIAFLFTIPYIIFQYRKYGSIPLLRVVIVYSFILYLISAYFLVILPLPSQEFVNSLKTPTTQLIPFSFIKDFINHTSLVIADPNTYLKALKEPYFYQVLYNIFLTLPFGIYLRYYFKFSLKKTIVASFLLSLFFELTQLTGLYGIYSRSYRLFDVDDLMINTLGGTIGYLLEPLFILLLPTRDKIDEIAYKKGEKVSFLRRLVAFNLDILTFLIMSTVLSFFNLSSINSKLNITIILAFCYYILIPLVTKGQTLGKSFLNIKIVSDNDITKSAKPSQIVLRNFILYFVYIPLPYYSVLLIEIASNIDVAIIRILSLLSILALPCIYIMIFIQAAIKKKPLLYERISKTKNASTIKSQYLDKKKEEIASNVTNDLEKECK